MTNVNFRLLLLAGAAAGAVTAPAQTHTAPHHTSAAAHRPVASECVTIPGLGPKLPALPPGSPCPKSLLTISEKIELSPLIGPTVREGFSNLQSAFTLAYVDQTIGTGPLAQPHMYYTVKYTGYLPDGTKFDSSLDHGAKQTISFPYGAHRVILGWDIGFEGMHTGGKRRLFIPYQLAYGERGRPPVIPPKSELIFDMELVAQSVNDPDAPPTPPTPPGSTTPGSPAPGSVPPGSVPPGSVPPGSGSPGSGTPGSGTPGSPLPRSAAPGSPKSGAILGNPPTVTAPQSQQTPPDQPRIGPDGKQIPPTGTPSNLPATPPTQPTSSPQR